MSTMLSIYPKEDSPTLLAIDEDEKVVYVDGEPCELTQQEFSLLQELAQNIDRPVSREELLRDAWGYLCPGETRTVDVHIRRLREKIERNTSQPEFIFTKWGVGYYFTDKD